MSVSPPLRRLSSASSNSKREEDLINAYEAEEERIINLLSRKLEQLKEEKISLERAHEEESESHVNRLSRELTALRLLQQQSQAQSQLNGNAADDSGRGRGQGRGVYLPESPSTEVLLEALKKENESLRGRLVDTERDYVRVTRLNEIYREELIDHRRRLGLPVDNLIGLSSSFDPYSQPIHRRSSSTASSSPTASMINLPLSRPSATHSVPIPRIASQIHRPKSGSHVMAETPQSHSPSSSESPFPFSPVLSAQPESFVSTSTQLTTPPSSASLQSNPPGPYPMAPPSLSYPSVPPPSLSSSLGSPSVMYHIPQRDEPPSPDSFSLSRRPSESVQRGSADHRVVESGNFRDLRSRRASVERGGRVAETGTLIRSRTNSTLAPMAPGCDETPSDVKKGSEADTKG
ncbi:hypothetical protein BD410DRAFT_785904 [Rickenella mellea]|uniref:Uncharacterized protein n=1 Tax=Rickenella mellea TaxID=50990 RepID=A0A4Y7QB29_9AGAM|nr:hypothetical protein BD410DRAFT_785904 [Rickenella mellea]